MLRKGGEMTSVIKRTLRRIFKGEEGELEVLKSISNILEEKEFSDDAKKALIEYSWPGNIRELINVVKRAAILSESNIIKKEDLF